MNNIIKRVWNQNKLVNIEDLSGMAFQAEAGGHTFEIAGTDDEGSAVSLSGTVTGVFMRPDGTDVALTGSIYGGVASVTLTSACYAVPGRFGLTVFVTVGSKTVAIYAAIGTVARSSTGTVAGDTPGDVVDLINAIAAAVATIPPSYTDLMASIAPIYSTSAVYAVGDYAWYDGSLYKCIFPITSGESWTAAHWASVVLTNDIKDLNKKALVIINTASGEVAHFTDGADGLPFKSILASILPVQDLHGYSKPWAGGAGTNLCRVARTFDTASTGITFTEDEFGTVHCEGTATAEALSAGNTTESTADSRCLNPLPAGSYTISNIGTVRVHVVFRNADNTANYGSARNVQPGSKSSFVASEPIIVYIRADILPGETVDADVLCMVTAGSTMATVFEPYQNICPITGRTSAKIYGFGKNLFNKNGVSSTAVTITQNSSGFRIVSNANGTYKACSGGFQFQTLDFPDGTEVTFSAHCKVNSGKARLGIRRVSDNALVAYSSLVSSGEADLSITYTYDKSTPVYLSMFCTLSESEAGDVEYTNIQLEIGSTVTSYEPYAGDTYAVDWTSVAGTIYKGSFDFVPGTLGKTQRSFNFQDVTPTSVSVLGEMTRFWLYDVNALANGNMLCNMAPVVDNTYYASDEIGVTYLSAYPNSIAVKLPKSLVGTTADSIRTFLQTGAFQMVQDLVTPVEYQLAPEEIDTLFGGNSVWSDSGSVSVEYPADTKLYIDQKIMALAAQILNG